MLSLSKIFWDICRLKAAPQDLPVRGYLLIIAILAGIVVDSFSTGILIPQMATFEVIKIVVIYNLLLLSAVYFLLKLLGYAERGMQTVTAMAGAGFFISLALLPMVLMLDKVTEETNSFAFLILADNIWRIAVNAHIFRHALSISLLMAMIIAMSYLLLGVLVADFLLPAQTS